MPPQPLVQFPQYPQKGVSVEKSNHQNGYDGHQYGDDSYEGDVLPLPWAVRGYVFRGDVNHKLRKARPGVRMASSTGRESGFFILERNALVCPVTIRTECGLVISEIYGRLPMIIFQIGCFLCRVTGTADLGHASSRFQP